MFEPWSDDKKEFSSDSIKRTPEVQLEVDSATKSLALYYYQTCWFCGIVRATIERLNLNIELRDIHDNTGHLDRLVREGGSGVVPCLYIGNPGGTAEWLYESQDISNYLEERFGAKTLV
ncbi:MAG TPA: hypothetical protein DGR97_06430 [Gammaproteobacteria bacterium]|nr:hypothetical protein [Gammaproteobacteria bacterium]|tara:strand:+ start:1224 stop:1580 length:357 start_codon:yes stop_codon:yes gene_type:complete